MASAELNAFRKHCAKMASGQPVLVDAPDEHGRLQKVKRVATPRERELWALLAGETTQADKAPAEPDLDRTPTEDDVPLA